MSDDLPFAITLPVGSSLANKTGNWRVERPVYVERQPPCTTVCPASEDVQRWLFHAEEGDYESAWRVIMEKNPLPAVMGRACFHPCEGSCNRAQLDEAVGINAVERFLGDRALEAGWTVPVNVAHSGRKILIIGSGPAGLSAAYFLRLDGHDVTIYESAALPGGMMRYGIPAYRLPRDVVDAEIARLIDMGVVIETDHPVDDALGAMTDGGFDAVVVAVGAQKGRHYDIPSGDASKVMDAVSMLRDFEAGDEPILGRRVIIYGGGDTAMDAARSATRLGAREAIVVYRRTRDRMPAHDEEVADALAEGVQMRWLTTIRSADSDRVMVERMSLDENGVAVGTGDFDELEADSLVLALGQDTDLGLLEGVEGVDLVDGTITVDEHQRTGRPGIFAGGDAASVGMGDRTLTGAIGQGRAAARAVSAYLRGNEPESDVLADPADFERINPWYYSDADRTMRPRLEAARRRNTFEEVVGGLTADDALFEARRCLSCGNCFECDNCFGVCPDNAVIKLGTGAGYEFNYDYCKGCGICVSECPCGAIDLVPERR